MTLLIGLAVVFAQTSTASMDGVQFQRVIRGLHENIKDCSFMYEGGTDQVGPAEVTREVKDRGMRRFQGIYEYRSDGSAFVDRYLRASEPSLIKRTKASFLHGLTETVDFVPDARQIVNPVETLNSRNPGLVSDQEGVPGRFIFLWYFRSLEKLGSLGFEDRGWEDVDGHRCLKIKLNLFAGPPPPGGLNPELLFWIDLGRGGHPLRFDYLEEPPKVAFRATDIKLRQFTTSNGMTVWFPVSGIRESYLWDDRHYDDQAVIRESYSVMPDSVLINQGLTDSIFSVRNKRDEPKLAALAIRKQFADLRAHPKDYPKTDRKSVEERLDRRLAEADQQATMIEATSPARQGWGPVQLVQVVANVIGIGLLAGILVHRMRARS